MKKNNKILRGKKFQGSLKSAQAIFLVLVIIAAVMAIGLSFGLINTKRLHITSEVGESAKSYFAAESGIECELYKKIVDNGVNCDSSSHMTNNTSYVISVSKEGNSTVIRSVGDSKGVYRAIEVRY